VPWAAYVFLNLIYHSNDYLKKHFPLLSLTKKRENYHRPSGGMVVEAFHFKKMNNSVIIIKKVESNSSALISHASVDSETVLLPLPVGLTWSFSRA
jgi:hypothetical protein